MASSIKSVDPHYIVYIRIDCVRAYIILRDKFYAGPNARNGNDYQSDWNLHVVN